MRILSCCFKFLVTSCLMLLWENTLCSASILDGGSLKNVKIDPLQSLQFSASTPEPATMLLLGIGLVLLAGVARKGKGE